MERRAHNARTRIISTLYLSRLCTGIAMYRDGIRGTKLACVPTNGSLGRWLVLTLARSLLVHSLSRYTCVGPSTVPVTFGGTTRICTSLSCLLALPPVQ